MKYRLSIMFLIVFTGMISIAAFNPMIGPLARNLGLSDFQSGCLVSLAGLCWLLEGYFWEKTFMSPKWPRLRSRTGNEQRDRFAGWTLHSWELASALHCLAIARVLQWRFKTMSKEVLLPLLQPCMVEDHL